MLIWKVEAMRRLFYLLPVGVILAMTGLRSEAGNAENTLYMDLGDGRVVIEMRPDLAPKHVSRIRELVRKGFYDGVVFHRVADITAF